MNGYCVCMHIVVRTCVSINYTSFRVIHKNCIYLWTRTKVITHAQFASDVTLLIIHTSNVQLAARLGSGTVQYK